MKLEVLKNKSFLILGGYGMAGYMITKYLISKGYNVSVTVRELKKKFQKEIIWFDNDFSKLEKIIINNFDIVINCIGILNKSNFSRNEMVKINTELPLFLNKITRNNNIKLVHLSTDCVFSGSNPNFYVEDSIKDATDNYAITKSNGEFLSNENLIIRKSLIGMEIKKTGRGLLKWFLENNKEIDGYDNWYWSGITTLVLARGIEAALIQNISGILHLSNGTRISKYDLLCLLNIIYLKQKKINRNYLKKEINKLLVSKRKDFSFIVPTYKDMINEMIQFDKNINNTCWGK